MSVFKNEIKPPQPYSPKPLDCWNLGVILYYLLYSTFPFRGTCKKVNFSLIFVLFSFFLIKKMHLKILARDFILPANKNISDQSSKMILKLLDCDPRLRGTCHYIVTQVRTTTFKHPRFLFVHTIVKKKF